MYHSVHDHYLWSHDSADIQAAEVLQAFRENESGTAEDPEEIQGQAGPGFHDEDERGNQGSIRKIRRIPHRKLCSDVDTAADSVRFVPCYLECARVCRQRKERFYAAG